MDVASSDSLREADVVAFLQQHPEFFSRHPELLLKLHIPHPQAGASSLLERQIKVARDKQRELQAQVNELLQVAAGNEQLFVQCQALVQRLLAETGLGAERVPGLIAALQNELRHGFSLDAAAILLAEDAWPELTQARRLDAAGRSRLGPELVAAAWCGTPTPDERALLFGEAPELRSAATLPLGPDGRLGLLALGSNDPERFRAGMGTLFLDFVGAVLGTVLDRR